ncbi:hypothetical protein A7X67_02795 [Clostridium sp. W14A]|nr:hypothetical protein A7X67_02795 [Clostridium sp. W14A]
MKLVFSCALVLHRPFDSAPPESEPEFRMDGRVLNPFPKPGGIYVFVDLPPGAVSIRCPGYQNAAADVETGQVRHICLYPDSRYNPPVGWQIVTAKAKPGGIRWIRDNSCEIRLLTNEREKQTICLYARPGFIGGSLLFSRDNVREQALILEKQPPNRYFLSELKGDYTGGTACRIYPGRGDDSGNCRLIIPQNMDFSSLIVEEG